MTTNKKVKRLTRLEREKAILEKRLQGWTHGRIADDLGIDRTTVTKTLARLFRKAAEKLETDAAAFRAEQLAQLDAAIDEALQAWRRSKAAGEDDPRFLAEARAAMKAQREILGLDVRRTEFSGSRESPIVVQPALDGGDLVKLLDVLTEAGALPDLLTGKLLTGGEDTGEPMELAG